MGKNKATKNTLLVSCVGKIETYTIFTNRQRRMVSV